MMPHSDAAKRASDIYNLHRIGAGYAAIGRWFAVALSDGRSDNVLYDNRRDAVIHQHHNEHHYTYIVINLKSSNPCEMEVMLKVQRSLADKGMKMADPDHHAGGMDVIKRSTAEDQYAQSIGVNSNLIMPWEA
jgi:hypothetical protein